MSRRSLLLLGLAVFLITALLRAPVATVHAYLAPRLGEGAVQPAGLSGTLSEGRMAQLAWSGRPLVRDLGWQLSPWWLLLGRASFSLDGGSEGMVVNGGVHVVPSGSISLSDFRVAGPLKPILAAMGQPFVPVDGTLGSDLKSLKLRKQWPVHADGTLIARGLVWKLGKEPVPLGDYEAVLEDVTGGVKATIRTVSGVLEVSGDAMVSDDRSWELNLRMRPKPDAPPILPNLVRSIGQPDPQGFYHLRRKGQVAPPVDEVPPEAAAEAADEAAVDET
ncbi:MAG TPA: type II secretion system protein N, partial [Nevskiaceae bacterium]|nr:type II secretion system protein N [Nevskiaceae bacterium]